ncbi:hypothetical protein GCM10022215_00520 [Nocardioides fonticola]|uniref:Uncharacterized protein n=1 Tax=Nocardioides fonticola TaxID=450363 RepID=A0ABP7X9D7_9ACTN
MPRRRFTPALAAFAVAAVGVIVAPQAPASAGDAGTAGATSATSAVQSTTTPSAKSRGVRTNFGMKASGYGSRVRGNQIPVDSRDTGYTSTGCTTRIGENGSNTVANVDLGGIGSVGTLTTDLHTEKVGGEIAAVSHHELAGISLSLGGLASLSIQGLMTTARAYHDSTGFHATTDTQLAKIVVTIAGVPLTLPLPTISQPITVPGLLRISLGRSEIKKKADFASARAKAVQIDILATDTTVKLAASYAEISDNIVKGRFSGYANTTRAAVLGDLVTSGPQVKTIMPCRGTGGVVRTKNLLGLDIPGVLSVGAARSSEMGKQSRNRATGFTQSELANVNLLNGAVVISAIRGRVNVELDSKNRVVASTNGTTIGSITVNGTETPLPDLGTLSIPGLLEIGTNVVEKVRGGLKVIAVQVKLLNGTGATINLGEAKLQIRQR